jgi:hypothetical protein
VKSWALAHAPGSSGCVLVKNCTKPSVLWRRRPHDAAGAGPAGRIRRLLGTAPLPPAPAAVMISAAAHDSLQPATVMVVIVVVASVDATLLAAVRAATANSNSSSGAPWRGHRPQGTQPGQGASSSAPSAGAEGETRGGHVGRCSGCRRRRRDRATDIPHRVAEEEARGRGARARARHACEARSGALAGAWVYGADDAGRRGAGR